MLHSGNVAMKIERRGGALMLLSSSLGGVRSPSFSLAAQTCSVGSPLRFPVEVTTHDWRHRDDVCRSNTRKAPNRQPSHTEAQWRGMARVPFLFRFAAPTTGTAPKTRYDAAARMNLLPGPRGRAAATNKHLLDTMTMTKMRSETSDVDQ